MTALRVHGKRLLNRFKQGTYSVNDTACYTVSEYHKLLAFYGALVEMFESNDRESVSFHYDSIQRVVRMWGQVRGLCSVNEEITVAKAEKMILNRDVGDYTYGLVEGAWRDLALHVRHQEARKTFEDLLKQLGFDDSHLFVYKRSVRLLGGDEKGPSVVTLVASNHGALMELLSGSVEDATAREVHLVL